MDFKYGKIYINFKEIQRFMEDVKKCCEIKGFKPDAIIGIAGGGELMGILASDVFGKDIQLSDVDKSKKLLVVSGLTTPRSISAYFKEDKNRAA